MVMGMRTRIQEVARERGTTAAELARRLGLYRSNLSAMDAGRRTPSLRLLLRLAEALGCGVADLLETAPEREPALFRWPELDRRILERSRAAASGADKGWVHATLLAWQRHYRSAGRRPR